MIVVAVSVQQVNNMTQLPQIKEVLSIHYDLIGSNLFHGSIELLSDNDCIFMLDIPEIRINQIEIITDIMYNRYGLRDTIIGKTMNINLGDGLVSLIDGVFFNIIDITQYQEMTIREIEKELGYKIKIKE